jgi:hypothetical protein
VHSFVEQATSVGEIAGGVALGIVATATTVPSAMGVSAVLTLLAAAIAALGTARWHPVADGSLER